MMIDLALPGQMNHDGVHVFPTARLDASIHALRALQARDHAFPMYPNKPPYASTVIYMHVLPAD